MDHMFTLTGTTLTVHLPSEVDHHSTEQLQRETDRLIQSRNIRCILFDFGDTVFMDSSGIGMLLGRYKMIRFVGGTMAAINVKERMRRVLLLSGVIAAETKHYLKHLDEKDESEIPVVDR